MFKIDPQTLAFVQQIQQNKHFSWQGPVLLYKGEPTLVTIEEEHQHPLFRPLRETKLCTFLSHWLDLPLAVSPPATILWGEMVLLAKHWYEVSSQGLFYLCGNASVERALQAERFFGYQVTEDRVLCANCYAILHEEQAMHIYDWPQDKNCDRCGRHLV